MTDGWNIIYHIAQVNSYLKLLLVCNIVLDWIATGVTPKANDWIIGEDGIIACYYYLEKDLNIKDVVVEWTMNGDLVYYNYNNETYSHKHLKSRATHQETSKQIKLIIHETKASDDGIYEAKIQGTHTATCQVNYTTRSKLFIYICIMY